MFGFFKKQAEKEKLSILERDCTIQNWIGTVIGSSQSDTVINNSLKYCRELLAAMDQVREGETVEMYITQQKGYISVSRVNGEIIVKRLDW